MDNESVQKLIGIAETKAKATFDEIESRALFNQKKVLDAYRNARISYYHFNPTSGYGYSDAGREKLSEVFAEVFGAESAIVSPNIVSGTHALTIAMFGLLKSGDLLLSATGSPYDTLQEVISGKDNGSLADYKINYDEIQLKYGGIDREALESYVREKKPTVVMLTRSRGYAWRDALTTADIEAAADIIKRNSPKSVVLVDNCYGEFVETREPTQCGADVIVGSLIKNAGGGLAPTGGYIAGKSDLIAKIGYRLTSPSIGNEVGSYAASYMPFFQGLFLAPIVTKNALKSAILASNVFTELGFEALPKPGKMPGDIICSIKFNAPEPMINFIQSIQYLSPVESYATPEPWDMPGYTDQVIMAAGTFVQGASIELSADGPVRAPYIAYLQGALTYEHGKLAISEFLSRYDKR